MKKALDHLRAADPVIARLIEQYPRPRRQRRRDPYTDLLHAVMSQQISVKAADKIIARFVDLFPDRNPDPARLVAMPDDQLRSVGVSRQKAGYLKNIAAFALEHGLDHAVLNAMTDEEVIAHLTQIKGVGRWTVEMLLMFTLGRPDILPVDDLGIQNTMIRLYRLRSKGRRLRERMEKLSQPWKPYRTLACLYLWMPGDATPEV